MKLITDELDATIMLVRSADPLFRIDSPALDTEVELRVLLANLPSVERRTAPRSKRPLALGAVGVAAAAATVAAINLAPGGAGVSGVLSPNGGLVSQAQAAQIIASVKRALAHYPPGEIVVTRETQTITDGSRPTLSLTYSQWLSTSFPYRDRISQTLTPGASFEEGTTQQGVVQLYDPSRNVIYQSIPNPGYTLTRGPHPGSWTATLPKAFASTPDTPVPARDRGNTTITVTSATARALRSGVKQIIYTYSPSKFKAHEYWLDPKVQPGMNVTGGTQAPQPAADWVNGLTTRGTRVRFDGKRAIEITDNAHDTWWFSAKTLAPIMEVWRYHGQATTTRYTEYRVLKGAAASTKLLSVQSAHPDAKLVIGVAPAYHAAQRTGAL